MNRRSFLGAAVAGAGSLHPAFAWDGTRTRAASWSPDTPARPQDVIPGGLEAGLWSRAQAALARHGSRLAQRDVMAVVDFSAASHQPRLHLVDLAGGDTRTLLVAHGKGSDPGNTGWLERFSNAPGSNASSSGSFLTGQTYFGKHGISRKLIGLDPQNNAAEERAIVIHGASYVSAELARDQGRIGRSQGCFAVAQADLPRLLARLGPGRLLYADKT